LEGRAMEDVGILFVHLVYFVVSWYILWLFGIFSPFRYVVPRKIWQPRCQPLQGASSLWPLKRLTQPRQPWTKVNWMAALDFWLRTFVYKICRYFYVKPLSSSKTIDQNFFFIKKMFGSEVKCKLRRKVSYFLSYLPYPGGIRPHDP
jgi:hypothetical protein